MSGPLPYGWDGITAVLDHHVTKRDGRLCIMRGKDVFYTPPADIRDKLRNRTSLVELARRLDYQWFNSEIAIAEFEASFRDAVTPAVGREAMGHLGNVLSILAELHRDDRCKALDDALAFYNAARPDLQVAPVEGYVSRLVQYGPLDGVMGVVASKDVMLVRKGLKLPGGFTENER